jgi:signal transduction histidine kinase
MKYWQKTYIATLLLFLVALNTGAYLMYHTALSTSISVERERGFAEHGFIRDGLEKDIASIMGRDGESRAALDALFKSYTDYYMRQNVYILLADTGSSRWGYVPMPENAPPPPDDRSQAVVIRNTAENSHLYAAGLVGDTGYILVTARNVTSMRQRVDELARTLLIGSAGLSALLAAALYLILKKLTQPIRTLHIAAAALANGDYDARATVRGRDELAELAHRFNAMANKIQTQLAELTDEGAKKQRFIDDLAHELRTPLSAIGGYAQYLAAADITEDERVTALVYISRESNRLADMSDKLLALALLRQDDFALARTPLPPLFDDVRAAAVYLAAAKNVTLKFDIADTAWHSDGTLLCMLFLNLIGNAIHACGDGGTVRVTADETGAAVSDNGCGMDTDALAHVMEPFYRADKARPRKAGGAGLGLSICERICERLGLEMRIDSAPQSGTTVQVLQTDDNARTEC